VSSLRLVGVEGIGELRPGDDLASILAEAFERQGVGLEDGDVLCIAQKAVSKVEGRELELASVEPSARAREIAGAEEDPRFIELVLRESRSIVRRRGAFLVCETHHGQVCASAGVDRSNASGPGRAILLPLDPDGSARRLRAALAPRADLAIVITDSFGRPFRRGTTGVGLGVAGLAPVVRLAGALDSAGRRLENTEVHVADAIASAAELLLGQVGGVPAALLRGLRFTVGDEGAASGLIPAERDLFRASGRSVRLGSGDD
jgi:coenzyme F420-0:L-glutamate ligase/coenzyme F420-1:gamma-L-glutamate ligase